ncbi:hypothetical protein [Micromonospora costi]|uniref:Uncharacterized protein n=1 Tax=Micromonospora costi TaxID=1530042 RepID=A0A3A9ZNP3_9ACTN|nr:hypothetical protein [Micromonospora costi]RKN49805.1 hypothetical protein D7193_31895 [Micromonospora costi]
MGEVLPMPTLGDLFADTRGEDRTMRVSYHPEREAVVLSLWSGGVCRGSFRMPVGDVPRLLALLGGITAGGATATPPAGALPPDRTDPRTAAVTRAPAAERAGGATGTAQRGMLPVVPAPRVA